MRAVVQYSDRPHRGRLVQLGPEAIFVGRRRGCQIRIDDKSVGRQHAEIFQRDGVYWIRALKDEALFVGGTSVSCHRLRHLDKVRCGAAILEYFEE